MRRVNILLEVLGRGLENDLHELLCPCWVGAISSEESPDALQQKLSEGLALWGRGQASQAEALLHQASGAESCGVAARAALACLHVESGDLSSALGQLRGLGRLCPDNPVVEFSLGLCYEQLGHAVSAMVHYNRAVALNPQFAPGRKRLAATALSAGRNDEAIRQYEALCRIEPENLTLRASLGSLHLHAGRHVSAAEAFENAVAMEPENWSLEDPQTHRLIGQGKVREAISRAHDQLSEQGPFADLHLRLANLYSMVGEDEEAQRHYAEALDIQPGYLEATIKLATHHLLFGRWGLSAELFARSAELNERLLANYLGMGVCRAAAGHQAPAVEAFDLAGAVEPNSTLLLAQTVRLHWKLAQTDAIAGKDPFQESVGSESFHGHVLQDELERHAEYVQAHPEQAEARYVFGALLRSAGRSAEAAEHYLRASSQHPTFMPALAKAGVMLKEHGRDEEAARYFHRMFTVSEEQLSFHYRLGLLYNGRFATDAMARQLGLEADPEVNEAAARDRLRLSLVTMGLLDRGAALWQDLARTHRIGA
jgi:tetratricopeptide (TPR) repeat protein